MFTLEKLKFLSPEETPELAKKFGTPLFVYDKETIHKNYSYFKSIPNAYGLTVRYSVKANPNAAILRIFDLLGASFDVSSVWEAQRCVNAGILPSKILITAQEISGPWENLCELGMEYDAGSLRQLIKYAQRFPNTSVSLRLNPGFGSGLVQKLTSGGPHSSFGLWFEQIDEAMAIASEYSLTIKRIHIHIGSGHDSEILERTVKRALDFCHKIPSVSVLNLGGGYKITALSTDDSYDHHAVGSRIKGYLESFFKDTSRKLKLEVEPGTALVALAGAVITRVIDIVNTGETGYKFIKIDAGLTEVMRPSYYGAIHPLVVVNQNGTTQNTEAYEQMVCGHCCIAGDSLTPVPGNTEMFKPIILASAKIDDFLVIERTGGYAASMSVKNFNSYPEASEVCRYSNGKYHMIRSRQTLEQIVQNELPLPDDY